MFANQIVLITGAGRGIGRSTALSMAAQGARIIAVDIEGANAERVCEEIRAAGGQGESWQADVADKCSADCIFAHIRKEYGRLDVLVNNVGMNIQKPSVELTEKEWDYLLDVNLKSTFLYAQLAGQLMLESKRGVIVNLSSILGLGGISRRVGYAAAKSAVESLTKTLACEWALDGVRVNAVAPGYILTEALQNFFDIGALNPENMVRRTPQGRLGMPEDIAEAILFLASDKAKFITGVVLYVDGGYAAYHGAEPVPSQW